MVKFLNILKRFLPFILCAAVIISAPLIMNIKKYNVSAEEEICILSLWQIDSFEGGKGSRSSYLQKIGDKFSESNNCFIRVTSLSAEAVRNNLGRGLVPDMISYGAGTYGLEDYLSGYDSWCNGGYCILSLDTSSDFSDITVKNTVINGGTDNLSAVTALFEGLNGAEIQKPTGAYISLINGKFKYLLGTQRDIFRLITREVQFTVKPVSSFNDLYQNISVTASDKKRADLSKKFISQLITGTDSLANIGLMKNGCNLYDGEMHKLEGVNYEYKLTSPLSELSAKQIKTAAQNCDLNLLKNLLK